MLLLSKSLTNNQVKNILFKPTIKGATGGGIEVAVSEGSFDMEFDWALPMVEEQIELTGNSSIQASGLDMNFITKFSKDEGKPKISVDTCLASIEKLDIQNEGGYVLS